MKCIALVIGINEYDNFEKLFAAVNDATEVAYKLNSLKFFVNLLTNIEYNDYLLKYGEFIQEIQNGYDVALLYFAGHGAMINQSDCLFLKDSPDMSIHGGIPCKGNSIVVNDICKDMRGAGDQINIVIIDACRIEKSRGVNLPTSDFGRNIKLPYQTFIAYSTSPGCPAKDGSTHSPYTEALLKHMDKEHLQIELLFKEVRKEVYKGIGYQMPWEHSSLLDHFAFNYGQCSPYYGALYSRQAYEDVTFVASSTEAETLVKKFKSYNVYHQREALYEFKRIKNKLNKDEKFVIGRNILQAAIGNCYACQDELSFPCLRMYQEGDENHVLNGILYETYFNHENQVRKGGAKYCDINKLHLLTSFKDFAHSISFIKDALSPFQNDFNYIPGDTSTHIVSINIEDSGEVNSDGGRIWHIVSIGYNNKEYSFSFYKILSKSELLTCLPDLMQIPSVLIKPTFSQQISPNDYIYSQPLISL